VDSYYNEKINENSLVNAVLSSIPTYRRYSIFSFFLNSRYSVICGVSELDIDKLILSSHIKYIFGAKGDGAYQGVAGERSKVGLETGYNLSGFCQSSKLLDTEFRVL
jgi:hypothetical protein